MVPRLTVLCAAFAGLLPGPAVTTAMYLGRQEPQPAQAVATALNQTGVSLLALPVAAPEALAVAPCYNNPFLAFARAVLGRRELSEDGGDDDEDGEEDEEGSEGYICCCYHRGCGEEVGCLLSTDEECPRAHFASEDHIKKKGRQPVSFCEEGEEEAGKPEGKKKCNEKGTKRKKLKKCGGPPKKVGVSPGEEEPKVVDVEKDAAVKAAHDALVSGFSSLPRAPDGKTDVGAFRGWGADKITEWAGKHSVLESAAMLLHTGELKDFLDAAKLDLADVWAILEVGMDQLVEKDTSQKERSQEPFKAYVQDLHWKKVREAFEKDKGVAKGRKASSIFSLLAAEVAGDGRCKEGGYDDAAAVLRRTGTVELAIKECQEARVRKHLSKTRDERHLLVAAALAGAWGMDADLANSGAAELVAEFGKNFKFFGETFFLVYGGHRMGEVSPDEIQHALGEDGQGTAPDWKEFLGLLVRKVASGHQCQGGLAQARKELLFFMSVQDAVLSCIVKRKLGADVVGKTDPGEKRTSLAGALRDIKKHYGKDYGKDFDADAKAMCSYDVFADQVKQACDNEPEGVSLDTAPCNKCCAERGFDHDSTRPTGSRCVKKHGGHKHKGTALRALRGLWRWGAAK